MYISKVVKMSDKRREAGRIQEANVAYYLQRGLKDVEDCVVINNLNLSDGEYNSQIDHLIVHRHGFIIIETKSIKGVVKVNRKSEWSRSVHKSWQGMASPIKQAEVQFEMLIHVLNESKSKLLGKLLNIQKGFSGRTKDIIVAISSDAIFDRTNSPKAVSDKVYKTEFIVGHIKNTLTEYRKLGALGGFINTTPTFTREEFEKTKLFLESMAGTKKVPSEAPSKAPASKTVCKSCQSTDDLIACSGRYGYFLQCKCGTNTSMKKPCPNCESKNTKVKKNGDDYSMICHSCNSGTMIGTYSRER